MTSEMCSQREVAADLGGLRWCDARRVVETFGVRVMSDGPRRWFVARADWNPIRELIRNRAEPQVVAS